MARAYIVNSGKSTSSLLLVACFGIGFS
jgi:hypothetical protein